MHELCLHKIRPHKSNQAIGPELQNARFENLFVYLKYYKYELNRH